MQKNSDLLLDDRLTRMMLEIIKWPSMSAPAVVCVLKYLCHFFANHDFNTVTGKQHGNLFVVILLLQSSAHLDVTDNLFYICTFLK